MASPISTPCTPAGITRKSNSAPSMCWLWTATICAGCRFQCATRLLARRPEGIFLNPFEQGEIGPDLFLKACEFGLEGLVSKHRDRPYQAGRSKHWIKMKNRKHLAFERVKE